MFNKMLRSSFLRCVKFIKNTSCFFEHRRFVLVFRA